MKILLYGINFAPELTGIGKYSGEMAAWFADNNKVRVITSPPYYPDWKITSGYANKFSREIAKNLEIIRCPLYIPSKPSTFKRILHLVSFSISSTFAIIGSVFWRPQMIILVVPTIFCAPQAILLSFLTRSKLIIHIQDYELDAMIGLSNLKNNFILKIAFYLEKKILNSFNIVSTISDGMIKKALNKGVESEKIIHFPNWTDMNHFKNVQERSKYLKSLSIDPNKKIILYSGNMGEKQGLEIVLEVAKDFENKNDLLFLMVGDGAVKNSLIDQQHELEIDNIKFLPLQPYNDLPSLLSAADCHLVVQKFGAADAVLPSKITNIFAVGGNAVITAEESTSLGKICSMHDGIATLVKPECATSLKEGILRTLEMHKPNLIATKYAKENIDRDQVLSKFLSDIS